MEDQTNYRSDGEEPKQNFHNKPFMGIDSFGHDNKIQELIDHIDILESRLKIMGEQKNKIITQLKNFEEENEMLKEQISRQNESNKKLNFDRNKFEKQIQELQLSNKAFNENVKAKFEILNKELEDKETIVEKLNQQLKAKEETGLPVVTELLSVTDLDLFRDVDVIQIGARNMQNFELLKEVGKTCKPVLLKRGLANTIEEWLMSAEYIMSEGNMQVILCERGIRTFEPYTRNTLDLSANPILKEKTHLPIIVDPSHASGIARLVEPMSLASVGAGADGLIIEVHNDPQHALCDGAQSIKPDKFSLISQKVNTMLPLVNKERD